MGLAKVKKVQLGAKGVPYLVTHDGRINIADGKILDYIHFEVGNLVMIVGGRNLGRVGVIEKKEKHPGSFDIVHIKDSVGRHFATRMSNTFIIGKGSESYVSL